MMANFCVSLFLLLALGCAQVLSLQCYQCDSSTSQGSQLSSVQSSSSGQLSCEGSMNFTTCKPKEVCMTVKYTPAEGTPSVTRGCSSATCAVATTTIVQILGGKVDSCSTCNKDLCNGAVPKDLFNGALPEDQYDGALPEVLFKRDADSSEADSSEADSSEGASDGNLGKKLLKKGAGVLKDLFKKDGLMPKFLSNRALSTRQALAYPLTALLLSALLSKLAV